MSVEGASNATDVSVEEAGVVYSVYIVTLRAVIECIVHFVRSLYSACGLYNSVHCVQFVQCLWSVL